MQENENPHQGYEWCYGICLLAITFCAYLPALHGGFIWDDDAYVTENLLLRDLNGLKYIWFAPGATLQYYPLTFSTFWLEFQGWQLWSTGYHLVNILLHLGNAILLWRILNMLSVPGAWFVAAVFALHPVHVESTAWIAERKNVLSGVLYLASLFFYLRFSLLHVLKIENHQRSRWQYYFSFFLFVGALLSKTATCTLPAVIFLLGWWKKDWEVRRELPYLLPFFVTSALLSLITAGVEKNVVGAIGEEWNLSFWERSLIAGRAIWFYIGKLVWPFELTFLYPKWDIDVSVLWQWLFPISVITLLTILMCLRERLGKSPLVAVLFFIGTLFPTLGFFDLYFTLYSYVADHFQYLASIGPLAFLGGMLWKKPLRANTEKKKSRGSFLIFVKHAVAENYGRTVISLCILVVLWCLTWQQGYIYESRRSLWLDTIQKNPSAWAAYNDLGMIALDEGNARQAFTYLEKAVSLNPKSNSIHSNLCLVHWQLGNIASALYHGQQAVMIQPNWSKSQTCFGYALLATGDLHRAEDAFIRASTLNPELALPLYGLGAMYLKEPTSFPHVPPQRAIQYVERALTLNPRSDRALFLVVQLLSTYPDTTVRNGQRALQLAKVLSQRSGDTNPYSLDVLAAAYAENNQFDQARMTLQRAITIAQERNDDQLLDQLRERLQLYVRNVPYRLLPTQIKIEPQMK